MYLTTNSPHLAPGTWEPLDEASTSWVCFFIWAAFSLIVDTWQLSLEWGRNTALDRDHWPYQVG